MDNNLEKNTFSIGVENFKKGNFLDAKDCFEKALLLYPENITILENLALTEYNLKNLEECEKKLRKIIELDKNKKKTFSFFLKVLREQDKVEELKKYINIGLEKKLTDNKFSIIKNIVFPFINNSNEEIVSYRDKTNKYLDNFLSSNEKLILDIDEQPIDPPIFNYSYDQFDNLNLNKKFINLFKKVYPDLNENLNYSKKETDKIKIGFISEYFTNHTIGKLFKGSIFKLDKKKFEIYVFHSYKTKKGKIHTEFLEQEINSNFKNIFLPKLFKKKVELLKKMNLDVVFYPDIGMSSELYFLTFLRFAKYQIVSVGHPISTGNPNIDFFISFKNSEIDNAQKHYSEKLILFKHLLYYYNPEVTLRLNSNEINKQNIYSCPQTLFKIHPDFDEILNKILIKDKKAKIYFIKDGNKSLFKKLISRFKKTISSGHDRIIFSETMSVEKYINQCGSSSVLLDPIIYGGGNSFYEAMIYGTPAISLPGSHLKNRVTLGAYKQMEVEDAPIVSSNEEYIDKAIEIANLSPKKLLDMKMRFKEAALSKLFQNKNYINELEEFLTKLF